MDRADGLGTGVAVVGHVALFGALSLGLAASIPPRPVPPPAMEVEFVDTVALEAVAAPSTEAIKQAEAPETGTPEDAMPQPAPVPEPLPLAPAPEPVAAPPVPAPPKPPEPKSVVRAAPKPTPNKAPPKPTPPKPTPPKPTPAKKVAAKPQKVAPAKPTPAKQTPAKKTAAKSTPAKVTKTASAKTATAQAGGAGTKTAARAPRLGKNFLAGLSDPSPGKADKPQAPVMSAKATADIGSAILRQVQPCANRQVKPGPGAERIRVTIRLRLNKDGSLAARPQVTGQTGVDDENSRYAARVNDLAIATFASCAPLKGLPADLYDVKNGWSDFRLRYKLPA